MSSLIHIDDGSHDRFYHSVCGKYSSDTVDPVRRNLKDSCIVRKNWHYGKVGDPRFNWCKECLARSHLFDLAEVDL